MGRSSTSSDGPGEVLDCSIYVDTNDWGAVKEIIGVGDENAGVLVGPGMRAYVAHNDYEVGLTHGSDFLSWPTVLECEQTSGREAFVSGVRHSLEALWGAGISAVAACEFEDLLPHSGCIELFR